MREYLKFYIDGQWVDPVELKTLDVINPATEAVAGKIALGAAADVDKAVKAARKAFATWSRTSREERLDIMQRVLAEYQKRFGDLATAVTEEMGAPASLAQRAQVLQPKAQWPALTLLELEAKEGHWTDAEAALEKAVRAKAIPAADAPRHRVNFICSVGYGDPASIFARSPRPEFARFNSIV